MTTISKNLLHC